MTSEIFIYILIISVISVVQGSDQNVVKCNTSHSGRNVEDIAKEVSVLQTKLQNMKEMAALKAKVQTIEATNDLIKEIAALQAKVQAREATDDIRTLQAKMKTMEEKLEANEKSDQLKTAKIEVLQTKIEANEKADHLKTTQIETLKKKLEATEKDAQLKTTQIEALQTKNAVCERAAAQSKATEDVRQQVTSLQAQIQEIDVNKTTQITNLMSAVQTIKTGMLAQPVTGFHVVHSVTMSSGSKIPFNTIKTNIGNRWNKNTHTFTAPVKGLYFFSLSVMTEWGGDGHAEAKIMHGSVELRRVYTNKNSKVGRQAATGSVVITLNAGEKVHAERVGGTLFGGGSYKPTNLSGFLIQKVK